MPPFLSPMMKPVTGAGNLIRWYLLVIASIAYLICQRSIEYLAGFYGATILADLSRYASLPIVLLFIISAEVTVSRSKKRINLPRWRRRTLPLSITLAGILVIVLLFASFHILVPAGLSGFRKRILTKADIPAIRNWVETKDLSSENDYYLRKDDIQSAPVCIKVLDPGWIVIDKFKLGNKEQHFFAVDMRWAGFMSGWGLNVTTSTDNAPPISKRAVVLQVEPGVYVYTIAK